MTLKEFFKFRKSNDVRLNISQYNDFYSDNYFVYNSTNNAKLWKLYYSDGIINNGKTLFIYNKDQTTFNNNFNPSFNFDKSKIYISNIYGNIDLYGTEVNINNNINNKISALKYTNNNENKLTNIFVTGNLTVSNGKTSSAFNEFGHYLGFIVEPITVNNISYDALSFNGKDDNSAQTMQNDVGVYKKQGEFIVYARTQLDEYSNISYFGFDVAGSLKNFIEASTNTNGLIITRNNLGNDSFSFTIQADGFDEYFPGNIS